MRVQDFIIPLGGKIPVGGDLKKVKLRKASGPVFIDTGRERIPLELGELAVIPETVKSVVVINDHNAVNVVQLVIMETGGADLISPSSSVAINNEPVVGVKSGSSIVGLPKMTLTAEVKTIAAATGRKRVTLLTDAANTGLIWVGGVENSGLPLPASATIDLDIEGEIPLYGSGVVYVLEVS
ncbi:hypothetical protein [Reinekea sp.]|jgi:hypothetical protein|uniref:hypothetical protein n=1 Tax=Reinekea sp. TaxID=1970455 RepID=UPI003989172D